MGTIIGAIILALLFGVGTFIVGYYIGIHTGLDTVFMALEVRIKDLPQAEQRALSGAVLDIFANIKGKYSLDELERRTRELDKPIEEKGGPS